MSNAETTAKRIPIGGEFLILPSEAQLTFAPEELDEDQLMIREMVGDYIKQNQADFNKLEAQASLLEKAGELGLVGAHIPEAYGGMQMDKNTVTTILEELGKVGGSFDTTFAAHTGIGMLPILYFGTEDLKQKYLPKMATGELKASYCLTEPGSGSDALAAKTHAVLDESGENYLINGQKMWITNAGFADVFIVFAQIDGDKFTGFVLDRNMPGLTLGEEEHKLGIKASSTRQVFFENVKVPATNILGEIGRGHLIAFNVLNIGRFKLGNICLGGVKKLIDVSIRYANERHQFKQPISNFGAIRYKIAQQHIYAFGLESAVYRLSDHLKRKGDNLKEEGHSFENALLESAEEYAIECAIIKVYGSEVLDYVVDEAVQIHGGYGYSEEYEVAGAFRDARINRIYEGTNEINRLLAVKMLLKRVMKGHVNMVDAAWTVQKELTKLPSFDQPKGFLAQEKKAIENFKKTALMTAGAAVKSQMDGKLDLTTNQQIIMSLADLLIQIYIAESAYLRLVKLNELGTENVEVQYDILKVLLHDAQDVIAKTSKDALASFSEGSELKIMMMGIQRFSSYPPQNVAKLRTSIAKAAIEKGEHILF